MTTKKRGKPGGIGRCRSITRRTGSRLTTRRQGHKFIVLPGGRNVLPLIYLLQERLRFNLHAAYIDVIAEGWYRLVVIPEDRVRTDQYFDNLEEAMLFFAKQYPQNPLYHWRTPRWLPIPFPQVKDHLKDELTRVEQWTGIYRELEDIEKKAASIAALSTRTWTGSAGQ